MTPLPSSCCLRDSSEGTGLPLSESSASITSSLASSAKARSTRSWRSGWRPCSNRCVTRASTSFQGAFAMRVSFESRKGAAGPPLSQVVVSAGLRGEDFAFERLPVVNVGRPERFEFLADGVALGQVALELGFDIAADPALADRVLLDLVLEEHETSQERLGARRAAGHVDIDWQEDVDARGDGVGIGERATHDCAAAHREGPFRFWHLEPDSADGGGHLPGDGAGDDEQVGLAWGSAENLCAEARDVVARRGGGDHLHRAAGQTEHARPERRPAGPVENLVDAGDEDVLLDLLVDIAIESEREGLVDLVRLRHCSCSLSQRARPKARAGL